MVNFIQKRKSIFFSYPSLKRKRESPDPEFCLSFFSFWSLFSFASFSEPQKKGLLYLFSSLLFSLSLCHKKKGRWMKNIQTKEQQRNFLKVLRMEMKKLSKFFFLETKTNNSNLISTNSNTRRFFFSNSIFSLSLFSLSLSCCSDMMECEWLLCCVIFAFVFILFLTTFFLLKNGMTALHLAAFNGFEQIVKILIEHGANVHLQDQLVFFFFDFHFFILFFLSLFVVVGSLLIVSCWLWMVELCDIWFFFF